VALDTNVTAVLEAMDTIPRRGRLADVRGMTLMARIPTDVNTDPMTYHLREVKVVSTTGEKRKAHALGMSVAATRVAIDPIPTWFFESR
jgi:hypothetical protein